MRAWQCLGHKGAELHSRIPAPQVLNRRQTLSARSSLKRLAEAYTNTSSAGNGVTPHIGKPVLDPTHWDGLVSAPAPQYHREPAQPLAPNRLRLFSGTSNPVGTVSHKSRWILFLVLSLRGLYDEACLCRRCPRKLRTTWD